MASAWRLVAGPAIVAAAAFGLVAFTEAATAQPPGFGKEGKDKGFDKGKEKDKGFEKGREQERPKAPADAVRTLEVELAKLKSLEADLEAKLKQLKGTPAAGERGFGPPPMRGFGPGGKGFGPPAGERGFGMPGGFPAFGREMASRGMVEGVIRAASGLNAEQLGEVIAALEKARAEKLRAPAPAPRPKEAERGRPEPRPEPRTERRPEPASQDAVLRRLDQLGRELEELRKMIRK